MTQTPNTMPSLAELTAIRQIIAPHIHRTPTVRSRYLSEVTGYDPPGRLAAAAQRLRPRMYQPPPAEPLPGHTETTAGEHMSGSRQKADPKLCWNCGMRGVPDVGSRMTCPGCEVTWMPWLSAARGDPDKVCWEGKVIFCVDFSRPGALGAPA